MLLNYIFFFSYVFEFNKKNNCGIILLLNFQTNKNKGETLMLESSFKTELKKKLKRLFPGCIVLHLNPNELQGVPDLIVLYGCKWATLEGKRSEHEHRRPNQRYYVRYMNNMAFSSFIYPENEQQVLEDLVSYFNNEKEKPL